MEHPGTPFPRLEREAPTLEGSPSLRRVMVAASCCLLVALAVLAPLFSSLRELPAPVVKVRAVDGVVELELPRDLVARRPSIEVLDIQRGEKVAPSRPPRLTTTTQHLIARLEGLPVGRRYQVDVRLEGGAEHLGSWNVSLP